jgi:hypothetical protein
MDQNNQWKVLFDREIEEAVTARRSGNDGRARVSARRAAGIVVQEFLRRAGIRPHRSSAYDVLRFLSTWPGASLKIKETCEHFLVRVNPDHRLPIQADLISDAIWLANELLRDNP